MVDIKPVYFSILPLILLMGCTARAPEQITGDGSTPAPEADDTWTHCKRLLGQWHDHTTNAKYHFHESWTELNDSVHIGIGCALSGADTVFVEDLKLLRRGGWAVYAARVSSQNAGQWVEFPSRPAAGDTIMFENTSHDFPRTIAYVATRDGGWNVVLNGVENGVAREERFEFAAADDAPR